MNERGEIQLTSQMIHGFVSHLLMKNFDQVHVTPECHLEWWELVTDPARWVAIAAPRGHAKSTAITHSFSLAAMLFRFRDHEMIISDTEEQAIAFLGDIRMELEENDDLRQLFGIKRFVKDKEAELIVQCEDGYRFRIIARGSNQKLRGLKWRNKRPNLVICDDMENDEMVMNQDRREKFRNWFFKALLPAGSDDAIFRVVGTILHLDSMLERLMPPINAPTTVVEELRSHSSTKRTWKSYRYRAHNEDFSAILWPQKFPKERLQQERQNYIDQGMPEGYAQEYLNYPIDDSTAYYRKDDFRFQFDYSEIIKKPLYYYTAADLAVSTAQRADFTAIVTAAVDAEGELYVVDMRKGRWDSLEIMEQMFEVNKIYKPEIFTVEKGTIEKALGPFLYKEMKNRGEFINLDTITPSADKPTRGRSMQARMRAGGVRFDPEFEWYMDLEEELRRFPRGVHDDVADAFAYIGLTLDKIVEAQTVQEYEDEQWEEEYGEYFHGNGRSAVTGY